MKETVRPHTNSRGFGLLELRFMIAVIAIAAVLMTTATASQGTARIDLSAQPQTSADSQHLYAAPSVSPGENLRLVVNGLGSGATRFQWQFKQADLLGATNRTLTLTNVAEKSAGEYSVIFTDASGSTSTVSLNLMIDPTFAKVTTSPIVTDVDYSSGGTWGDYNNDGLLDLFVYNGMDGVAYAPFLYQNNGNGIFTRAERGAHLYLSNESYSAAWGDYDNDGNLDLFVSSTSRNMLFHNNGDGSFTQITGSPMIEMSSIGTWVDYDNDGYLDLFLAGTQTKLSHNSLYRNNGDGTFTAVTNNVLVTDTGMMVGGAWADYDNDGFPDVFVVGGGFQPSRLYHNNGDGTFTRVNEGNIVTDLASSRGCAWGDYDNDGFLDLFVVNQNGEKNYLYHNNGDGTFTRVMSGDIVNDIASTTSNCSCGSYGCAWGDYDNDGFLDLYVGNEGSPDIQPTVVNFLYHNNGDGTFTRIRTGSPANEYSDSWGVAWADYNNDGFLDLFASRGDGRGNSLYQNNGNSNGWLVVRLVGTVSNRAAIGAKVWVKAVLGGKSQWQVRQITGGSVLHGSNELRANFGLGQSPKADVLRIEWPSGAVQEFTDVPAKQILNIEEPPRLSVRVGNVPQLFLRGGRGLQYDIQQSSDLRSWASASSISVTNLNGFALIPLPEWPDSKPHFFRAQGQVRTKVEAH
jgi:hypothetical protein